MPKQLPPLSLYIHIPWCEKKCPYCDFNSHENKDNFDEQQYIDCLLEDFERDSQFIQGRPLHSIFIGGGTPSLFSVESINRLLNGIKTLITFEDTIEITIEANPASSQDSYFSDLSTTLVNRVSLGVQSFQNDKLAILGRLHSGDKAQAALKALSNNFSNFNIDLMFGLSEQTKQDALYDLQTALSFSPKHLSWYQLTIEQNTVFYRNRPTLPSDDTIFSIQEAGQKFLKEHHFQQYEISAYSNCKGSISNNQSQHNLNYWNFGDYIGIGAGAHGKITTIQNNKISIQRLQKKRMPKDYLQGSSLQDTNIKGNDNTFIAKKVDVLTEELGLEFFMNRLRLNVDCDLKLFESRTGLSSDTLRSSLLEAETKKLITVKDNIVTKTTLGERHLDALLGLF